MFYYYWGKENRSLYPVRGLRYIEVRYIEIPLYYFNNLMIRIESEKKLTYYRRK